jgi:hypothetical protein
MNVLSKSRFSAPVAVVAQKRRAFLKNTAHRQEPMPARFSAAQAW